VQKFRQYANFNILHVKLENTYLRPQNWGFWGFCPQNGEQYERDPQKAHSWAETRRMTYRSSKSASRRIKQKKLKKGIPKKPQHVFSVFAQTTHVVAVPHGFACVVIPATRLYIPTFIEIGSGVLEPQGVKIWPFPLLWLVAFSTACTTVQAVMLRFDAKFGENWGFSLFSPHYC